MKFGHGILFDLGHLYCIDKSNTLTIGRKYSILISFFFVPRMIVLVVTGYELIELSKGFLIAWYTLYTDDILV